MYALICIMVEQTKEANKMKTKKIESLSFYIGSNNKTKKVEITKIKKHFNKMFKGYSIYKSVGLWESMKENSVLIKVFNDDKTKTEDLKIFTENLKDDLKQYAIIIEREYKTILEV